MIVDAIYIIRCGLFAVEPVVLEQSEEFSVDHVCDLSEVSGRVLKAELVAVDDDQRSLIRGHPVLVALLQSGEIVEANALLERASPFLDVLDESGDT